MYSLKRNSVTTVVALTLLVFAIHPEPTPAVTNSIVSIGHQNNKETTSPITASADAPVSFSRVTVETVKAPEPIIAPAPEPVAITQPITPSDNTTVEQNQSEAPGVDATTGASTPEVVTPTPELTPVEAPVTNGTIYVGLIGTQAEIDLCQGPVLMTKKPALFGAAPYITEHDFCGGWERFGNLQAGQTVSFSGNVQGSYMITGHNIVQQPRQNRAPGTGRTFTVAAGKDIYIQTCIPGTLDMVIHHGVRVA